MLLADNLGAAFQSISALSSGSLSGGAAWLGAICYSLQLYFDFSGYSDMAIGMAKLFGFDFDANFDHPYLSASLTEFWRRWHISPWPLVPRLCVYPAWRQPCKHAKVHPQPADRLDPDRPVARRVVDIRGMGPASRDFAAAGKVSAQKGILAKTPSPIRHILTLLAVIVGWVLFFSPDFSSAIFYLGRMFGAGSRAFWDSTAKYYFAANWKLLVLGILGCGPWIRTLYRHLVFSRRSPGLVLSALLLIGIFPALRPVYDERHLSILPLCSVLSEVIP